MVVVVAVVVVVVMVVVEVFQTKLSRRPEIRLEDGSDAEIGHRVGRHLRALLTTVPTATTVTVTVTFTIVTSLSLAAITHAPSDVTTNVTAVRRHGHRRVGVIVTDDVDHFLAVADVITPADVRDLPALQFASALAATAEEVSLLLLLAFLQRRVVARELVDVVVVMVKPQR